MDFEQKWTRKTSKIKPKRLQKPGPGGVPHRLWGTIRWGTPASRAKKSRKKTSATKKGAASHRVPPFLRKMWPTWPQLGSQKIDQKFDASWDRFLMRFWWILGEKMEASWHPTTIGNVHNFDRRFFIK